MVLCSEPWEDVRFKIGDLKSERNSDATALARAAAVVRHRGDVDDGGDLKTDGLEAADGGVAAEAGAADADLDFFEAVGHGVAGGVLRHDLGGVGDGLARAAEVALAEIGRASGRERG